MQRIVIVSGMVCVYNAWQDGSPRSPTSDVLEALKSPDQGEPVKVRFEMHAKNRDCVWMVCVYNAWQDGSPGSPTSDVLEALKSPDQGEPVKVRFEMHAQNRDCVRDGLCL